MLGLMVGMLGCTHGFEPPAEPPVGEVEVAITYLGHPEAWPTTQDSLRDLRFVAMQFVPEDTTDFFQLNRMAISDPLERRPDFRTAQDTVLLTEVEPGLYPYSGVAQQFSSFILDWRPVGLYEGNGGIFTVRAGERVHLTVQVDFRNPPPFPPEPR